MFAKARPLKALAMLVLLFSLAGVPPMLGFFGKFYVLKARGRCRVVMTWLAWRGGDRLGHRRVLLPAHRLLHVFSATGWTPALAGPLGAGRRFGGGHGAGVVNLFGIEAWAASAAATLVD
jgi:NADH-quinone oxidoreductase subunit N